MASTIKLKNGSGAPLASDLVQGEPALDLTNKRLYTKDSGGDVIEVGTNPTSLTTGDITATGTTTLAGATTSADINFGDNDKAIFGAGDDLQIYHDGSNSYIADEGTGELFISGASSVGILNGDRSEYMINAVQNGAVTAYHNGSAKLATTNTGIDVTGTVTADGFLKDNQTANFKIVDFGGSSTEIAVESGGQLNITTEGNNPLQFYTNDAKRAEVEGDGDIIFYASDATTKGFFWDASAESLGIGTTSPAYPIDLSTSSAYFRIKDSDTAAASGTNSGIRFEGSDAVTGLVGNFGSTDFRVFSLGDVVFASGGASTSNEAMRIDSSGRVLLGTSLARANFFNGSLSSLFQQEGANASGTVSSRFMSQTFGQAGTNGPIFTLAKHRSNSVGGTTVVASGDELGQLVFQGSDGTEFVQGASIQANVDGTPGANDMPGRLVFNTTADGASSPTERMRIDSSGNLLVGTTNSGSTLIAATSGGGINIDPNGYTAWNRQAVSSNQAHIVFNQTGVDAKYFEFRKDGSPVGSIGNNGSVMWIASPTGSGAGLRFDSEDDRIVPTEGDGTNRNGAVDLGYASSRFKDLYLSGGVYLGGTGAANHLDDYEEGTFTPQFNDDGGGGDFASAGVDAKYTKVGRLVNIHLWVNGVTNSGSVSISGNLKLDDLPFTCDAGVAGTSILRARNVSSGEVFRAEVSQSTASIIFYKDSTETRAATSDLLFANGGTNDRLIITLAYLAA